MIPYRIAFSGIRDYKPTIVDLSGDKEHILISGANGAGKSTLTFCWGAVMASGKVNLEGLRSKNLSEQHIWRAKIELVFQNNGAVDAARYVKFTLFLEQQPNSPIKREYEIAEGDEVDQWEHTLRFTSSHKSFDFQEYKRQLLQKYLLDPDAFYLIWYQQDVNQFAVMRPEERFRIFSEMTGIEEMQKRLESIKEREKELQSALQDAKNNQRQYQLDLGIWEREKDRYIDQQRRLKEGFQQYVTALRTLEVHYEQERSRYKAEWEQCRDLAEDKQAELLAKEEDLQQLAQRVQQQEQLFRQYDQELEQIEQQLSDAKAQQQELKRDIKQIADDMQEITEKVNKLPLTEEQVVQRLAEAEASLAATHIKSHNMQQEIGKVTEEKHLLTNEIAELKVEIRRNQKEEERAVNYLRQYTASYLLHEELGHKESTLSAVKDNQHALAAELRQREEERQSLTLRHYVSPRQQQSLRHFKRIGIQAYALQDLIELTEEAELQAESVFNTIKYSVFVEAKGFTPPNDLYHVPLPLVVPTESVVTLPKYSLRIKETLSEELIPIAMKALWWMKQFTADILPAIRETGLHDQRGVRGAQEQQEYILSEKAIQSRLASVTEWLKCGREEQQRLVQEADMLTERTKELRGIIHQVEQAEAFLHQKGERVMRAELLQTKEQQQRELYEKEQELRDKLQLLHTESKLLERELQQLQGYKSVYDELQREQENIQRMQKLQERLALLEKDMRKKEEQRSRLTDQSNEAERGAQKLKRKYGDEKADFEELQRYLEKLRDLVQTAQSHYLHYETEWQEAVTGKKDFVSAYPDLLAQLQEEGWREAPQTWTELQAKSKKGEAAVTFDGARKEKVNPLAPENYSKMKEEHERSNHEVTQSQRMVEETQEHLAGAKERLELTIRMGVRKIHDRFERYMEQFHFEGEVTWEMAEDRRGELRYYLYIKARKKGHRGKLEDISAKGRGGKVGSGVSGGEESLASLLFALALLQTIEASPGYIILDEYDSALDDNRKEKVFVLFEQELGRKMIIVSPKSHDATYLAHFAKAFTVIHDASVPVSKLIRVKKAVVG